MGCLLSLPISFSTWRLQVRSPLDHRNATQLKPSPLATRFRTSDYGPLLQLSRSQLTDRRHLLGRLLSRGVAARGLATAVVAAALVAPRPPLAPRPRPRPLGLPAGRWCPTLG